MPELPGRSDSVGWAPPTGDRSELGTERALGTWTFQVRGGPAFGMNAALALRIAARECETNGARQDALERLATAIEEALPDA